jgi:hypothetical protein
VTLKIFNFQFSIFNSQLDEGHAPYPLSLNGQNATITAQHGHLTACKHITQTNPPSSLPFGTCPSIRSSPARRIIPKIFGYLAQICLVIWRNFVWLFGANSFGCLAKSHNPSLPP